MKDNIKINIIILVILIICLAVFSQWCIEDSRSDRNMVYIEEGYCYDKNTKIIYIESYSGRHGTNTTYSPYYDSEGNLCKYINEEFVPIKEE